MNRLLGLETEYAIRFVPAGEAAHPGSETAHPGNETARPGYEAAHPGNDVVYEALRSAIGQLVATAPGASGLDAQRRIFTENGGSFYYEFLPHCAHGGLIEGSTPECRGPGQVVLYQQAQEKLLLQAIPVAEELLAADHHPGKLGLVKNSRDALDNVFGSQENYEAELASGLGLWLYRLGLALLVPVLLLQIVLVYAFLLLFFVTLIAGAILSILVAPIGRWVERITSDPDMVGGFVLRLAVAFIWPVGTPQTWLLRGLAFRRIRQQSTAFLVSRVIMTGSGAIAADGRFELSEKGPLIQRVIRSTVLPSDRSIFDVGNMLKSFAAPIDLRLRPFLLSFQRRQRLQIGHGDSNRAQVAELLRLATMALVVDMIEDGFLQDAPRLEEPVAALHQVCGDPSLRQELKLRSGETLTALQIQRFYLDAARRYLQHSSAVSVEARQIVALWDETLTALEGGELGSLVGRIDWITKRYLVEQCADIDDVATMKTVAIRYHELGEGFYDRLVTAGETATLVEPAEVARAVQQPPSDTPAFLRGGLIRRQFGVDVPIVVSWDSAYLGKRLRGKVIPFRRPE